MRTCRPHSAKEVIYIKRIKSEALRIWRTRPVCVICVVLVMITQVLISFTGKEEDIRGIEDRDYVTVTGKISSIARTTGFGGPEYQVYLDDVTVDKGSVHVTNAGGVRAFIRSVDGLHIGQSIKAEGKVSYYEHATNPGQFDAYGFYHCRGICFDLYEGRVSAKGGHYSHLKDTLYRIRLKGEEILELFLDEDDAAVCKAMLFGNKNEIDKETKDLFRRNGIAHILAISGLHISFLAMLLFKLLEKAGASVKFRALISGGAIILYGMMVGFSASAFRAVCMFLLYLAAAVLKRTYDMLTAMSVALTLVSLTEPGMLRDSGLKLSYLAVLGVGYFYASYKKRKMALRGNKRIGGIRGKIIESLGVSFFVFLATLPAVLMTYSEAAFYSVLLNLMIIPFMSILLTAIIALVIIGGAGLPVLPKLSALVVKVILGFYKISCKILSAHNMGRTNVGSPQAWQALIFYLLLVVAVIYRGRYARVLTYVLTVTAVAVLFICPLSGLNVWMLDIGQGDCMVICEGNRIFGPGSVYVIDCGSSTKKQVGDKRLVPMLKYYGVDRIDGVFITHPDSDHLNGIEELVAGAKEENLSIGTIYVYEGFLADADIIDAAKDIRLTGLHRGMCIDDGDLKIRVLYPYAGRPTEDANEASLMMRVSYGDFSMITTGDAGMTAEGYVVGYEAGTPGCSLLKVGHHGSSTSTGEDFLDLYKPAVALISCGAGNSYGHPHSETLQRLKKAGAVIYRTDKSGAVRINTDGKRMRIKTAISY